MSKRDSDGNFMAWLNSEIARRGREREVAALVEQMKIEDQLIELRRRRGLSQAELAEAMGVKQPVVARIESGRARNLTLATIARTAESLGARVEVRLIPISSASRKPTKVRGHRRHQEKRAAKS